MRILGWVVISLGLALLGMTVRMLGPAVRQGRVGVAAPAEPQALVDHALEDALGVRLGEAEETQVLRPDIGERGRADTDDDHPQDQIRHVSSPGRIDAACLLLERRSR